MNLDQSAQEVQQAIDFSLSCATKFSSEVIKTIDDAECLDSLLDTMEFLHAVCSSPQFSVVMQILTEALDLTSMPEMLPYSQDNSLSDLFFSSFMSEMVVAVMNEIGGDDI